MLLYFTLFFITLFLFYNFYWKRRNFPPGPIPLPFVGNLPEIGFYGVEEAVAKFKNTYGDLHTIWFGETPVISVNDFPTIYENFVKNADAVSGREPKSMFSQFTSGGYFGVVFTDGQLWKEHRRFGLKVLRDLGMGKDIMQQKILNEVTYLLDDVKNEIKSGGVGEINIHDHIDRAVGSVINSIVLGYRFDKEHEHEFYEIKDSIKNLFRLGGHLFIRLIEKGYDWYRFLPFISSVYNESKFYGDQVNSFIVKSIDKHKDEFKNDDEEPTDYVEAFLKQQRKLENEGVKNHLFFSKQLIGMVADFWAAGQETTSTSLAWAMVYLTQNQNIQQKIHNELDSLIGSDRLITIEDKNNLHYINAVVQEVHRYANFGPFNLFHRTTQNIEIKGYKIPQNTIIVDSMTTVHMDERYFDSPKEFRPERFIDKNGKFLSKPEVFPFGVGKRSCMGEGLARMEMFLFTANIFNQFKITQVPSKPINGKRIVGATATPEEFVVRMESRH